ncbi:MAG: heme-dependent peroxidase [Candidatus Xiphinematobacter sp.]|nr:MAG: heme-dependent peroxidase [Candidatus Xiphinematobacter sp.]QQY11101.1 MAG: heme-dependent peroxidase [Candidatus Xiphinematobacter sp.]
MIDLHKQTIRSPIVPKEGWHVLHSFCRMNYARWESLTKQERAEAREHFLSVVQRIRSESNTQLLTMSMVGSKADMGFILISPDLHMVDCFTKQLTRSLGPQIMEPILSWLSITELSEYTTTETEYMVDLRRKGNSEAHCQGLEVKLADFRSRMTKYSRDRLYPCLPDWPVVCFYPMSKRRHPSKNWYALDFIMRKRLMAGHARLGRTYTGRVRQLITGSTGLDDMEWGVTLFAHTVSDVKEIVYEMRFDSVSAEYAEFGEFFIGLQLLSDDLLCRLGM